MKTVIPSIGSRGDVQPYIALARGLQAAGHAVTLASHPGMRGLVESYGVSFAPMGPDIDIGQEAAKLRRRSPTWMIGFIRVMKFSFDMLEQSHADILKLCQGVDFVIVPHSAGGSVEADQLGLRTISVTLMPQAIPVNDRKASALKRVAVKAMGAGMGLFLTRPLDQIRKRLGVPPMGPTGITSPLLNLIALSPQVIAPDPRWEERHKMTGYWFAPAPSAWEPPADLRAFLEADDPPVVVSLGAMALGEGDALETAHLVVEAVRQSGLRAPPPETRT